MKQIGLAIFLISIGFGIREVAEFGRRPRTPQQLFAEAKALGRVDELMQHVTIEQTAVM